MLHQSRGDGKVTCRQNSNRFVEGLGIDFFVIFICQPRGSDNNVQSAVDGLVNGILYSVRLRVVYENVCIRFNGLFNRRLDNKVNIFT